MSHSDAPRRDDVTPADLRDLIRRELEEGGDVPPPPRRAAAPRPVKPEVQKELDAWLEALKADLGK